jgi:hypothetical protein
LVFRFELEEELHSYVQTEDDLKHNDHKEELWLFLFEWNSKSSNVSINVRANNANENNNDLPSLVYRVFN